MDDAAEEYVKLVLAVGRHDPDYVDAYYGPAAWRTEMEDQQLSPSAIEGRATAVVAGLPAPGAPFDDDMEQRRVEYLRAQLGALIAFTRKLGGQRLSFDDESRALYDAVAPSLEDAYFERLLAGLDGVLPGAGSVLHRYEAFRAGYAIPPDRVQIVFDAAIDAARVRTREYIRLPPEDRFEVEYVTDRPWSGYNWYQGEYRSVIQVNTDLPLYIDRALDLACHEGYPGHHVYNALLEHHLVRGRGWPEFSVYPLFSPQSLIAEGTANYGIEMAFPEEQRLAFGREVLYPLAGIDAGGAERYGEVQRLITGLDYAVNEAARRFLDGVIDRDGAVRYLMRYGLMSPDRAAKRVAFIERYRSYVINYNLGLDIVRTYMGESGPDPAEGARWRRFADLLSTPRTPSALARDW